ncbi:hypothetical protein POM88_035389 [Heracleum sosnowskyi]|uniref:Uncharacterized protein n=1 Tax=Heracleum sosnowskyi TaxID=360622 RepID=A0AAD8HNA0_9APIA|nr:hypothetical protein POM88_035389 [Heracleum sosnowskyi]
MIDDDLLIDSNDNAEEDGHAIAQLLNQSTKINNFENERDVADELAGSRCLLVMTSNTAEMVDHGYSFMQETLQLKVFISTSTADKLNDIFPANLITTLLC